MKGWVVLASSLAVLGCGCAAENGDSDAVDEHEHGHGPEPSSRAAFYQLLQYTHTAPVQMPLVEVVARSTAIVFGTFADVRDGRVVDFREGASHPAYTAVFELQVDEVLKGEESGTLYAEFWRAPVTEIEALRAALPDEPFVFVLGEPGWDEATYVFENAGAGVPASVSLHAFHPSFGMITQGPAGLEYPLMSDPVRENFRATTLNALIQEIESLRDASRD